jgi:hypothetical protein
LPLSAVGIRSSVEGDEPVNEERHECPSCGAWEQIDKPTRHLLGCPLAYQDPPVVERLRARIDADPASRATVE